MMGDILKRIKAECRPRGIGTYRDELWNDAADEIRALSARNDALVAALRECRKGLAEGLETECGDLEAPWSKADRKLVARIDALLTQPKAAHSPIPLSEEQQELEQASNGMG